MGAGAEVSAELVGRFAERSATFFLGYAAICSAALQSA